MTSLNQAFLKAYQKSGAAERRRSVATPTPSADVRATAAPTQSPPAPHFAHASATIAEIAAAPGATGQAITIHAAMARTDVERAAPLGSATRAYIESTATSAPSPLAHASTTLDAAAPPAESPAPLPAPSRTPYAILDAPHGVVRPPHAKFAPPTEAAPAAKPQVYELKAPALEAPTQPIESKAPAIEPKATRVELKAQPVETPIFLRPQSPIAPAAAPVWQPVFELSNFIWPEITEAILAAAPGQLQTAATDLAEACRRHRKLVAVTGVRGGEGASVIAMTLARALAAQQQKVVLVDAHFAAPRLANCLGVAAEVGWEESLAGERPLAEAVVQSLADHVSLLPLKQATPADWRLAETRLKSCFDELRRHFDVVLIDAGPLGEPSDRRQLLSWAAPCRVDRALVVLDCRAAIEQDMAEVDHRLQGCGIAQWSFVDNFAAA